MDNLLEVVLSDGEGEETETVDTPDEPPNLERELEDFRLEWKQELNKTSGSKGVGSKSQSKEELATSLYMQGAEAEQNGELYVAIAYYKKAMQLVPDIESKIDFRTAKSPRERQDSETSVDSLKNEDEDLLEHLSSLHLEENRLCSRKLPQNATHISDLPFEVIIYILRWVVSSELDIRSLEIISQVCRGFYICARDDELWKSVCTRIWGSKLGKVKKYGNWRKMCLERPHVFFNGCYISKVTYYRPGEQSLDGFYRPIHVVEYYRMVRLFSDGCMLMSCSPEDPQTIVPKLRSKWVKGGCFWRGHYKLSGNKVTAELVRTEEGSNNRYKHKQRNQNVIDTTFYMELEISSSGKRVHNILSWKQYTVTSFFRATNKSSISEIELTNNAFPPMYFSRVKSYSNYSDQPL